jgi:hypothetical protein
MGYDIHITRADEWTESKSTPITLDEWKCYVASDPEFRMDNYAEATTPKGDTIRVESEGLSVWMAYSKHGHGGGMAWFDYYDGEIVVKNADEEIRSKMKAIARHLGAKVVGDDGEEY